MKAYIESLMLKCDKARHGELSEDEMSMLVEECKGFSNLPVLGRPILNHASTRNWSALKAALAPVMQIEQQPQPSVMANINPTIIGATASSTSNYISIVQSFPESTLSDEDKDTLTGMLAAFQNSEGEKKKKKLMDIVKWLGDKAVDVSIQVIPLLAGMM